MIYNNMENILYLQRLDAVIFMCKSVKRSIENSLETENFFGAYFISDFLLRETDPLLRNIKSSW